MSYPACETSPASLARREARPVTFVPAYGPPLEAPVESQRTWRAS